MARDEVADEGALRMAYWPRVGDLQDDVIAPKIFDEAALTVWRENATFGTTTTRTRFIASTLNCAEDTKPAWLHASSFFVSCFNGVGGCART